MDRVKDEIKEMERQAELVQLTITGSSINEVLKAAFEKIDEYSLTMDDVEAFERYLSKLDAFSPLTHTTWNINGGAGQIKQGQARSRAVRRCWNSAGQRKNRVKSIEG